MRRGMGWMVMGAMIAAPLSAVEVVVQWREGAPLPLPRGGAAVGWAEGKLILAGGTWWESLPEATPGGKGPSQVKRWSAAVHAYDPQSNTWSRLPDLPHPVGHGVGAVVAGSFYLLGGADERQSFADCFRLVRKGDRPTPVEQLEEEEAQKGGRATEKKEGSGPSPGVRYLWQALPPLPEPRVFAGAGAIGDTLYLVGGARDPNDLGTLSNSLWSWQPDQPQAGWQTLPPLPGPPRGGAATVVCANHLFVFGGFHLNPQGQIENLADAYLYSPSLRKWQRLASAPLPVRGWGAAAIQNRFIALCGGFATVGLSTTGPVEDFVPDVWVYDVRTNRYLPSTPLPHAVMDALPVCVEETLYLAGGEDRPRHRAPWTMIGRVEIR